MAETRASLHPRMVDKNAANSHAPGLPTSACRSQGVSGLGRTRCAACCLRSGLPQGFLRLLYRRCSQNWRTGSWTSYTRASRGSSAPRTRYPAAKRWTPRSSRSASRGGKLCRDGGTPPHRRCSHATFGPGTSRTSCTELLLQAWQGLRRAAEALTADRHQNFRTPGFSCTSPSASRSRSTSSSSLAPRHAGSSGVRSGRRT